MPACLKLTLRQGRVQKLVEVKEEVQEDLELQQDIQQSSAVFIDIKQTEIDALKAHVARLKTQLEGTGLNPVQ